MSINVRKEYALPIYLQAYTRIREFVTTLIDGLQGVTSGESLGHLPAVATATTRYQTGQEFESFLKHQT